MAPILRQTVQYANLCVEVRRNEFRLTHLRNFRRATLPLLLFLTMASCAPMELPPTLPLASYPDEPYPEASIATPAVSTSSGYPGLYPPASSPTVFSTPTKVEGYASEWIITPRPGERVVVDEITEIEALPTPAALPYSVRYERIADNGYNAYLTDNKSGREVRLNDDNGSAWVYATTPDYIIWRYVKHQNAPETFPFGLHAYEWETGNGALVSSEFFDWYPEADGEWVVYALKSDKSQMFNIHAQNLRTGANVYVGAATRLNLGSLRPNYGEAYDVFKDKLIWKCQHGTSQSLCIFDLNKQTNRFLNVAEDSVGFIYNLELFDRVAMWQLAGGNRGWKGYDLREDAEFTIPAIPPGWEETLVQSVGPFTAEDNRIYWTIERNNQPHYFTAVVKPIP